MRGRTQSRRRPFKKALLKALIEEAIIDAYTESEQRTAFYTMLEEHLHVPFEVRILDVTVTVERIDMKSDNRIVAICHRGRSQQSIAILDLPLPSSPPKGSEWIEAYRLWETGG